jgi:hypothetical protein
LLFIFIVFAVIFIIISNLYGKDYNDNYYWWSYLLIVCSVVLFIASASFLITIGCAQLDNTNIVVQYNSDKEYIEAATNNPQLSEKEHIELRNIAINYNNKIQSTKLFRNNSWVGWFYAYKVGDLQLFDLTKIGPAQPKSTIQLNFNK